RARAAGGRSAPARRPRAPAGWRACGGRSAGSPARWCGRAPGRASAAPSAAVTRSAARPANRLPRRVAFASSDEIPREELQAGRQGRFDPAGAAGACSRRRARPGGSRGHHSFRRYQSMATANAAPAGRSSERRTPSLAPLVFYPSLALIGGFVAVALLAPGAASRAFSAIQDTIVGTLGWYYVLLIASFVVFSLWLGLSRFGDVRLGRDGEPPEFGLGSWFAMLFSAGMGIGLVFWGVAEPLNHFAAPRPGFAGDPAATARHAMTQTYVHWGLHAWAIYVVAGLAIALAVHRRGRPISIRWALEPLLGRRAEGRRGALVGITAVVGPLFGAATSLGVGG